jgi:hypothetical protein
MAVTLTGGQTMREILEAQKRQKGYWPESPEAKVMKKLIHKSSELALKK